MNPIAIAGGLFGIVLIVAGASTYSNNDAQSFVHDGVVVNCTNNRLVMTDEDGVRSTHEVTQSTKVTKDGTTCEAADLISGTRIRVTTMTAREGAAIAIDAFEKYAGQPDFNHVKK